MAYLPLMLDVGGRRAVVFGLNALTAQRIRQLLDAGAVVDLYVPGVEGVGSVVEDVRGGLLGGARPSSLCTPAGLTWTGP
ncbi:hypothetical protein [Thermogymnomonas acidicola]|uniref:NAD(P)-dependent oxidoreductase n=1 Tax=Thermogymnomonas acidicola TaxID=399579 RepID=UPI001396CE33|nr:NAD(P)-dependent oxidoreductase [Thermogymnomonas acidicola]